MADDQTKLVISVETLLKGLDKTLAGLNKVEAQLKRVAGFKPTQSTAAAADKAVLAAQRLANQQQRLSLQTQELANRQLKAQLVADRLALSQLRLETAFQRAALAGSRAAKQSGQQADAHVKAFRVIQRGAEDANAHVRAFRAAEDSLRRAPQLDAHVRAFRAIQRGAEDANHHVRAFRANEDALRRAPQMDAHVRAFRAIEESARRSNQQIISIGNSFRSIGQGLASFGATLSVALTAPLALLGTASVRAAVSLDSLKRGLTAIVGSSSEAATQLARLTQIAKLPGIGFEEAIQGSIRLQAVGFSALDAEKALKQFSNAVALTGGGRDELARITVQLGQLAAKGKVLSQDLRPIIEAAPAVGRALKQAFGTVNADDIADLTTNSREFLDVLVSELEKLPRAAGGARNSFENFRDTVFRAAAAVGEALLPPLVKLAEIVGPVITALAQGFAQLPAPLKVITVGTVAFLAALGPVVFIVGQLATGIGRVIVGLAQLNAQGLLPTIANLRLLGAAAASANVSLGNLRTATVAASAGLVGLVVQLGLGLLAYAAFNQSQKKAVEVSAEQVAATKEQVEALKGQVKFLDGLERGVSQTAEQQDKLRAIYASLNVAAQTRVTGISDEEQRLAALRAEIERLLQLELQRREQQVATTVANLANAAAEIQANERTIDANVRRVQANTALVASLEKEGEISQANAKLLFQQGVDTINVAQAVRQLQARSESLTSTNNELGDSNKELATKAEELAAVLRGLGIRSSEQARQFLVLGRAMGLFQGDIEATLPILEQYINLTDRSTDATRRLSKALDENASFFKKTGEEADAAEKARKALISGAASTAREAARDFEGAVKFMQAFIKANPALEAALKRQAQIQGKSVSDAIADALGGAPTGRSGTALRNAQEQLAKSLEDVALASADRQKTIEQNKIEQQLRDAELGFKRQVLSYRTYLNLRANLTDQALSKEAEQQTLRVVAERKTQASLLAAAQQKGVPATERVRRQQQAAEANERAIRAETKLAEIEAKRAEINDELKVVLAEMAIQQEKDVRQLEIEYATLTDRIQDALNIEAIERFRERLLELGRDQDVLNGELQRATAAKRADDIESIKLLQSRNQREIETIQLIVKTQEALAELAAAEELVTNAKEKQALLERQIAFDVEFRGQTEEEAIRRRLEGEAKVAESLRLARSIATDTVERLRELGIAPPKALTDFVRETTIAIKGLGELPFVEQFRLAQKEFDKLNDARIQKIAEVERAVAHRDISELQGRIAIKLANGEYIGALEQQLVILRQIAAQSGDIGLQRQAADAATVAAEVRNASTEVADFGTEIAAVRIDALRDGFSQFLQDVARDADNAKEHLLNMLDSVLSRINQVIADRVSDKLIGALFGDGKLPSVAGGVGAGIAGAGTEQTQATAAAAAAALQTGATTAAAALTTGGTSAGAALATGAGTASASLAASITAAAASFAGAVIAAGAAFAAAVAAGGAAQAVGGLGSALGGIGAATGMYPAVPGGMVHIVEGGYDEAVLTTDPKYAAQQVRILREYLTRTKGLFGRLPQLAEGGMVSAQDMEANFLRSLSPRLSVPAPSSSLQLQSAATNFNLRNINLIDRGAMVSGHLRSAEGARDILNIISTERDEVGRRIGVRQ